MSGSKASLGQPEGLCDILQEEPYSSTSDLGLVLLLFFYIHLKQLGYIPKSRRLDQYNLVNG